VVLRGGKEGKGTRAKEVVARLCPQDLAGKTGTVMGGFTKKGKEKCERGRKTVVGVMTVIDVALL